LAQLPADGAAAGVVTLSEQAAVVSASTAAVTAAASAVSLGRFGVARDLISQV